MAAAATSRRTPRLVPPWVVNAAFTGTATLIAASFILSFDALTDLARRSGVTSGFAFLWPLIVDGIIVVATTAIISLVGHPRTVTWFPWFLLFAGAFVSVAGNTVHAILIAREMPDGFPTAVSALVASVPPLVLLAVTHLLVLLMQHSRGGAASRATRAKPAAEAPKEPRRSARAIARRKPEPTVVDPPTEPVAALRSTFIPESPDESETASIVVEAATSSEQPLEVVNLQETVVVTEPEASDGEAAADDGDLPEDDAPPASGEHDANEPQRDLVSA